MLSFQSFFMKIKSSTNMYVIYLLLSTFMILEFVMESDLGNLTLGALVYWYIQSFIFIPIVCSVPFYRNNMSFPVNKHLGCFLYLSSKIHLFCNEIFLLCYSALWHYVCKVNSEGSSLSNLPFSISLQENRDPDN